MRINNGRCVPDMILQSMSCWNKEKNYYPQAIQRGVEYLQNTDFSKMEPGRYEIEGNLMFVLLQEVNTRPANEQKPESHEIYTDIQYVIRGEELIGVTKVSEGHVVSEDMLESKDLLFYSHVENETELKLYPGMFAVFYPSDIHRPCCSLNKDQPIRKAVIKIHRDLLINI
jgi:biofilm protein TabA